MLGEALGPANARPFRGAGGVGHRRRIRRPVAGPIRGARCSQKILIANRGEIAVRVMRTCRELGIATVAVYSELDRDALHVRYADEAYALGGQTAAESYLNTDAHPRRDRAAAAPTACTPATASSPRTPTSPARSPSAGVTWIGPPPEAIEVMGDKISSRKAADRGRRRVACPARSSPITDVDEIVAFGEEFGWPVAIKAAYGGGGKGMKVVARAPTTPQRRSSRRTREAQAYFGRAEATSSATSPGRATSSSRSSPTRTATACGSASATARRSAGTRS